MSAEVPSTAPAPHWRHRIRFKLRDAAKVVGGMVLGALVGTTVQRGLQTTGILGPGVGTLIAEQQSNFAGSLMIRLHATKASINGYKVRLLLSMLGLPHELVELDMYGGEQKREPFLSLNPFGQMPALEMGHSRSPIRTPASCTWPASTTRAISGCRLTPKARQR
jgi:hypothetical protein